MEMWMEKTERVVVKGKVFKLYNSGCRMIEQSSIKINMSNL
jgi:hypothetical protein